MKVTFLGHAACLLEEGGKKVLIDPFLTGNPVAAAKPEDLHVDAILVTHGHGDHFGDTIAIARQSNAMIVAMYELAYYCQSEGAPNVHGMNIGGAYDFDFGRVKLVQALHSSGKFVNGRFLYMGEPCGFIVQMGDYTIYHAGDTGLFGDMALIGEQYDIDLAFLPIGDDFVMGPEDALRAVQMLMPKMVVPIHYDLAEDAERFDRSVEEITDTQSVVLQPGESIEL